MKNKTKYLVAILLMLISFLLIGATNVNAKTITVENEEELINASRGIDSEINEIKLAKDITLTKFLNFYIDGGYYEMISSSPNFFEFFSRDYYTNRNNSRWKKTVEVSYKKITFTIAVEEVTGATVDPDGTVTVSYGDNKDFTITANTGYKLVKVLVNDVEKALDGNTYTCNKKQMFDTIILNKETN